MVDVGVPGVEDTAGLARWIRDNDLPGAGADLTVELIAGGRSNLTYRLEFRPPGAAASPGAGPVTRNGLVLGYGGARRPDVARGCEILAGLLTGS